MNPLTRNANAENMNAENINMANVTPVGLKRRFSSFENAPQGGNFDSPTKKMTSDFPVSVHSSFKAYCNTIFRSISRDTGIPVDIMSICQLLHLPREILEQLVPVLLADSDEVYQGYIQLLQPHCPLSIINLFNYTMQLPAFLRTSLTAGLAQFISSRLG
jgi:hypothetical protein